jgi:hypothetical protein
MVKGKERGVGVYKRRLGGQVWLSECGAQKLRSCVCGWPVDKRKIFTANATLERGKSNLLRLRCSHKQYFRDT